MAEKAIIARYLGIALVQGGADTFVQNTVSTDILPENGFAFKVVGVDVSFGSTFVNLSADSWVQWSITRDTKTAAANLSDPDTMLFDGFSNALTTSGQVIVPARFNYPLRDSGIYIVEPTIYAQLGSSATGITNSAYMRIYYEEVKVSEVEILRILNNS